MNADFAELVGAILGDGHLDNCQNHYRVGITGDPINDKEYFEYLQKLIKRVWNKDVPVYHRGRGIRMVINSKPIFLTLTQIHKLPVGDGKSYKVIIPDTIAHNWNLARHTIRGIVDTDGTIFTADKRGAPKYPSIEISTCSIRLAEQLRSRLLAQGFRVANIWKTKPRNNAGPSYRVPLNGYENVRKWMREIGFSNPVKRRKAESIIAARTSSDQCTIRTRFA